MPSRHDADPARALAAALERGEVVHHPTAPFDLPEGEELAFLLRQRQATFGHKNISYHPAKKRVAGYRRSGEPDQARRLADALATFSRIVTAWVHAALPMYGDGLRLDAISFRPEEEATRRLRTTARNDLLHIDAFPNRPTRGDRILRVFANVNPTEPRVWLTSDPFAVLVRRYGPAAGLPGTVTPTVFERVKDGFRRLFKPDGGERSAYDSFMLRLHDYLKRCDAFQAHSAKTVWHFQPGSVWLAMTDACSHAVLRGRYALEHSYFVTRGVLVVPDESPIALLEGMAAETPPLRRAA